MSVQKRIGGAIDAMESGDPEAALFQICAAIDETARREFGQSGRGSYKEFIHQNLDLITDLAFGGTRVLNLNVAYDHPDVPKSSDGTVSIQDLLYHIVRCGLYHRAAMPDTLRFTDENQIRVEPSGNLVMPASLIYGLIGAVVVAPSNRNERTDGTAAMSFGSLAIPISHLWGRRAELRWLLEARREALNRRSAATGE